MFVKWTILLAVLCAWASATLVTRVLLVHSWADPDTLMALRYTVSAAATGILAVLIDRNQTKLNWKLSDIWGGVLVGGQAILFGIASKLASASITGLCFFGCASLTASLAGIIFNRRFSPIQFLGFIFGLLGLIVVLKPGGDLNTGALLAVMGGIAWGGYLLWSKYRFPSGWIAGMKATSRIMAIGAAISWIFAFSVEPHGLSTMDQTAWIGVLYMGLIPQAVGFVVFGWLAGSLNPIQLGVSQFGTPILIVLGGIVILGESTTWTLLFGLGLVILGMIFASKSPKIRQYANAPTSTIQR